MLTYIQASDEADKAMTKENLETETQKVDGLSGYAVPDPVAACIARKSNLGKAWCIAYERWAEFAATSGTEMANSNRYAHCKTECVADFECYYSCLGKDYVTLRAKVDYLRKSYRESILGSQEFNETLRPFRSYYKQSQDGTVVAPLDLCLTGQTAPDLITEIIPDADDPLPAMTEEKKTKIATLVKELAVASLTYGWDPISIRLRERIQRKEVQRRLGDLAVFSQTSRDTITAAETTKRTAMEDAAKKTITDAFPLTKSEAIIAAHWKVAITAAAADSTAVVAAENTRLKALWDNAKADFKVSEKVALIKQYTEDNDKAVTAIMTENAKAENDGRINVLLEKIKAKKLDILKNGLDEAARSAA
jgi:hypothetical protein